MNSSQQQMKIIHIDMDCFYAAIEARDNPVYRYVPLAVGGAHDRRGVICTCNYIARRYGVKSAMPTRKALQLCPDLIVLPPDIKRYKLISNQLREIFLQYTTMVEPLSFDESYLDVTNCSLYQGSGTLIAKAIREQIYRELDLTASAGVAPNKFLAKIASDWRKPNGQFVISPPDVASFIIKLPVSKIFGVGEVTALKLHKLGLKTCGDLQKISVQDLIANFGKFGQTLHELAHGIDNRQVEPNRIRKSISVEETFVNDLPDIHHCLSKIPMLISKLKQRAQDKLTRPIKNIFVKIKFKDFSLTTAECQADNLAIDKYNELCKQAYHRRQMPVRLLGVGIRLVDDKGRGPIQLDLNI